MSQPDVSCSHSQAHLIQSSRRGRASGARPPTRDRTGWDGTGRALPDSAWPLARVRHGLSPTGWGRKVLPAPTSPAVRFGSLCAWAGQSLPCCRAEL